MNVGDVMLKGGFCEFYVGLPISNYSAILLQYRLSRAYLCKSSEY